MKRLCIMFRTLAVVLGIAALVTVVAGGCGERSSKATARHVSVSAQRGSHAEKYNQVMPSGLSSWDGFAYKSNLYAIDFVNANQGWATADTFSAIIHTSDGGRHWVGEPTPQPYPNTRWYGIDFVNTEDGWAVGHTMTLRGRRREALIAATTNGGRWWVLQKTLAGKTLYGISCVNETDCWVVGRGGLILATTNGGINWHDQSSGVGSTLYNVKFVNTKDGWAVGDNETIIATTDGGARWKVQLSGTRKSFRGPWDFVKGGRHLPLGIVTFALIGLYFQDTEKGWVVGGGDQILHTTNGGITWGWEKYPANVVGSKSLRYYFAEKLNSVFFLNENQGWAVGDKWGRYGRSGVVYFTKDGGKNWIIDEQASALVRDSTGVLTPTAHDVYFSNNKDGWIAAGGLSNGIVITTDGGRTWTLYKSALCSGC